MILVSILRPKVPKLIYDDNAGSGAIQELMIELLIASISIVLSYFLSIGFGAVSSGLAIFIGNLIGGVLVLNIIYARVLKINLWLFFRKCQLDMALPFVLVIFAGITLNHLIPAISWVNTFIKIIILLVFYSFIAYYTAINNYEKELLFGIAKRLIKK